MGPAETGRGCTRFRGDPSAAELDAVPIVSTARRGFSGELGPLPDYGLPLIEGMPGRLANSLPHRRQRAFTRPVDVSGTGLS